MTPILYEKDEIDFTSQGLGSLVEIYDVDVEEQRNGLLQLTASYPVSGLRYADISVGRIILAKPNQRDDVHAFRIVSTELDISGYAVKIEADSITYDLTHNLVKHLVASGNGQSFMTALKNAVVNPSIFAFYSDIATSSTTSLNYVNPMEAIMGTTGSFLQIWGGELKRENRRVAMFNRRGRDNVATFRLGKNIAGLKYSVDISSLVTRIIPTKSVQNDDQTTTTLEGTPVDSQYINNYEQIYTLPLEFTDDTINTVADLNAAAKGWFTQSANTGRDKPTVTIDIDVLSLHDSADYQDKFKNLESVSLTDTVTVYVPEYGVNVTAIVNELHYDPILDRVTKMTVGTAKQSFADSSRTQLSDLQDKIISVQNQADAAAVSANGKSKNYYGSVKPSNPQEGDTWFWVDGDKSGIKVFVNGDWVEQVDSDTQSKIADAVDDAVAQANAHTDEVKQGLSSDIATAKSQAASLASTAEANAKSAATSQFTQAQNALVQAKTDITNAYKTADGVVNKKIDDTASSITTTINQNKQDADGKISTAQTTATTALNGLSSKVSQTDYDAKTGQLTTSVSKAQQTADTVTTSLGNYKQDADGRISANSADIITNANAIKQKVAQSDYDANNTMLTSRLTTVETTANGTATTVSNLQQTVNNLGQLNRLLNTEFNPDYAGWTAYGNVVRLGIDKYWLQNGSNNLGVNRDQDQSNWGYATQKIAIGQNTTFSFSVNAKINSMISSKGRLYIHLRALDVNGNVISDIYKSGDRSTTNNFEKFSIQNAQTPAGTTVVELAMGMYGGGSVSFNHPFFVLDSHIGNYVAGNYSNSDYLAQVKITADGISNFVRDSSGNISSDFQTALSKTSIIIGSTLATSIQTQTATQITQALTDNNKNIIAMINLDTSGVQIAGKNIVLNGDTTVTGAFKVSQANIANGAIGTAQIGDAAITSAKIAEIDAGKITTGVLNSITANSMTLNAGTINGAAIYVTSMQTQIDGSTQNVRLGINPNWQHQLHIEPVSQSSGWYHYLYAGNDHLFLGAWDGSNSNTYDNRVALFTEGGSSEIDVGTIRIRSSGSAIYDDGYGDISGVTSISMKGSDPSYTSMYVGVGNNGTGEFRVVTNATIGTSNLNYADARAAHWYTSSLAKYKTNISEMVEGSALEMINRAGIYKYQFKTDVEADNDKYTFGPVIGDDYLNNPVEFLDSIQEGTDDHSASWITMKALQEEDSKVESLIARIEELEEKLESVGK